MIRAAALSLLALAAGAVRAADLPDGIYSNEEQVYFEREAGRRSPPWLSVRVERGTASAVDAFGKPTRAPLPILTMSATGLAAVVDGTTLDLRRGRAFACWVSIRKAKPKPDGGEDWSFNRVTLHDAGGRASAATDDAPPRTATIRMRNVAWQSGPNRPSLVLYAHRDDPDRAEGYAWADPGARRVGINLRWMQASCTLQEAGG